MSISGTENGASGDRSIDWDHQLQQHSRWLRTVIIARTRDFSAVDEVLQELAVIVAEQGGELQNINNIQGWLYRVTVRQSLLYRRKKRRHRKLKQGYTEYQTIFRQQQVDPLQWLLAEETRQLVRTAMKKLTGKENEILMLKYSENWSYQQLAEHLGINGRAVASRLNRARNRLRTELQRLNVNEVIS